MRAPCGEAMSFVQRVALVQGPGAVGKVPCRVARGESQLSSSDRSSFRQAGHDNDRALMPSSAA
jgi:hypothetical protein